MAEAQQLGRVGDPRVRQCAMRLERQLVVAGIALSALAIAQSAEGASEAHFGGDDVRITVDEAGLAHVGSSRVDLQACKLEYSIVSPK